MVGVMLKLLGPLLVLLALSLITLITYTFFAYVLPLLEMSSSGKSVLVGTAVFFISQMIYNYIKAISTNPGTPPLYEDFKLDEVEKQNGEDDGKSRCNKCDRFKPPRCHHCSVCQRCVLKMDHHCPWINNCVGWYNYRYFMLFKLYLATLCFMVIIFFFPLFSRALRKRGHARGSLELEGEPFVLMSVIVCVSISTALCMLGGFHVFLTLTNQTTIEFQANMARKNQYAKRGQVFRNPYNLGWSRNFQQVFGPSAVGGLRWMLSWWAHPPSGNGMSFPSVGRFTE